MSDYTVGEPAEWHGRYNPDSHTFLVSPSDYRRLLAWLEGPPRRLPGMRRLADAEPFGVIPDD